MADIFDENKPRVTLHFPASGDIREETETKFQIFEKAVESFKGNIEPEDIEWVPISNVKENSND